MVTGYAYVLETASLQVIITELISTGLYLEWPQESGMVYLHCLGRLDWGFIAAPLSHVVRALLTFFTPVAGKGSSGSIVVFTLCTHPFLSGSGTSFSEVGLPF